MFIKHPNSSKRKVYELDIWDYPEGMVYNYMSGKWEDREIHQRSPIKKDQYWERIISDFDWDKERVKELDRQEENPDYIDPKLESYRLQEWDRRINGFWFMNNGVPTYITGAHYFYLNWWYLDGIYPDFRMVDRDFFMHWKYCEDDPNSYGMIEATSRRAGKALPLDTEIPTPNGFKTMKDLNVGDEVFGANGKPVNITYKSPIHYNHDVYKIHFNDGSSIKADSEHQWEVTTKKDRSKYGASNSPKRVLTTKDLIYGEIRVKGEFNYQIDLPNPVEFKEKKLPINPYLFGSWIGGGGSSNPTFTSVDNELLDAWKKEFSLTQLCDNISYYVSKEHSTTEPLRTKLKKMGFLRSDKKGEWNNYNKKRIPETYKTASVKQRIDLIQGLMDTDGYIDKKGRMEYCVSNNAELADDVVEVLRSLSIRCTVKPNPSKLYGKDCGIRFRIYIQTDIPLFRLKRKKDRHRKINRTQNTHKTIRIVGIDKIESEPTQCISVDSDRSVYLASRNYIVTHNTYRAACVLYEYTSRTMNAQAGIQSKTDTDANSVFDKLVLSFINLPDFFQPIYDDAAGTRPKKSLDFKPSSKRGKKGKSSKIKGLESEINYRSSGILGYDSQKLKRYLRDECGKDINNNIYKGWGIVKPTLRVGTMRIVGKALYTTTVEEGGSDNFRMLWNGSDPTERPAINRTRTGLYRFFTPSYMNDEAFIDKYGHCDAEASKKAQMEIRESLKDNPHELAGEIRKNPFNIKEAFFSINEDAIFDSEKINRQIVALSDQPEEEYVIRGNFQWEDGIKDSKVIFVPTSKGKFLLHGDLDPYDDSLWNAVRSIGLRKKPLNENSLMAGCDPYDHKTIDISDVKRMSDGTGYVFNKYDGLNSGLSETFLCEYVARPPDPDMFFEDMIKMCFFFGTKINAERNKSGIINYFDRRGYSNFLEKDQKGHRGVYAGNENKEWLAEVTESYIKNHCQKVRFVNLLADWNKFNLLNSKENDCSMGAGWALVAAYRTSKKLAETHRKKQIEQNIKKVGKKKKIKSTIMKYL